MNWIHFTDLVAANASQLRATFCVVSLSMRAPNEQKHIKKYRFHSLTPYGHCVVLTGSRARLPYYTFVCNLSLNIFVSYHSARDRAYTWKIENEIKIHVQCMRPVCRGAQRTLTYACQLVGCSARTQITLPFHSKFVETKQINKFNVLWGVNVCIEKEIFFIFVGWMAASELKLVQFGAHDS